MGPYPLLFVVAISIYVWLMTWIAGIVIAKGFWSTFFAIFTSGFWSTYLVIEQILKHFKFL